jgi:hemerythrin superfamily protein
MDIYTYLQNDHRKVSNLLDQIASTADKQERTRLFNEMKELLLLHADTENATFYDALRKFDITKERIENSKEEHDEIKEYLEQLGMQFSDEEKWLEQIGELKQAVTHHVKEEEGEIFEKAKKVLSKEQANQLATAMDSLKQRQLERA